MHFPAFSLDLILEQPAGPIPLMLLAIAVSLLLLAKAGSVFTDAALALAHHLRLPPILVGVTLVSLATTAPELAVSWMAVSSGAPDVALGNILGSCSCNLGLVLGASALLFAWRRRRRREQQPLVVISFRSLRAPWLLSLVALGFLWTCGLWSGTTHGSPVIPVWESVILISFAPFYFAYCVWTRARHPVDTATAAPVTHWSMTRSVVVFLIATAVVLVSARVLFVNSVHAAREFGVSEMVIGLTVVALGTCLPELVCAMSSAIKGRVDLSVGNILGANILNLSAGIGFAGFIGPISVHQRALALHVPIVLLLTLLLGVRVRRDGRLSGRAGLMLLGAYTVYLLLAVRVEA